MPVYILREGQSNNFKIGLTKGDTNARIRSLQTGNSQPLSLFDSVETDQENACEAFFHRRLRSRRVIGGGWEIFEIEVEEMRRIIKEFRRMLLELEDAQSAVSDFDKEKCNGMLLEPTAADQVLLERLMRIKEEQEYLEFECKLIESKLKQRIGTTSGIRGIATWKSVLRRNFDEKLFRDSAPEMYSDLLETYYCLDKVAWRKARPKEYESVQTTYYSPTIYRTFLPQKTD